MLEIFQYEFMIRALLAGVMIGAIAPLIGMFLVVRRYALIGDTLAHVSLFGVALGLAVGIHPIGTALGISVGVALFIEYLRRTRRIFGEALLALFLSGSLAGAVVLISITEGFSVAIFSYLFGSITTVTPSDLVLIFAFGIVVAFSIALLYKKLLFVSLDEELAISSGIRANLLNMALMVLVAVTVSLAMRVVGALLIGALLVIPVVTALQFRHSFFLTMLLAIAFSLFSVLTGLFLSFSLGVASGGMIVIVSIILFLVSLLWNKK
ncbi:MAG: metal ABC transporter permease [bacterium]|nr:metal ABC transporter permease [bacterium]